MNTRKHPRTMQEAFGPYTSHGISETKYPMAWQDKVVLTACAVVVCALGLLALLELL